MFEKKIIELLDKTLGRYVDGIHRNQMSVGVWKGNIELKDLEFKQEALQALDLPVQVRRGRIGSVRVRVPWRNLRSKPMVVKIDQVYLVAGPMVREYGTEEEERKLEQEIKQQRLARLEARKQARREADAEPANKPTFRDRLFTHLINNVQIEVTNVHIRYEDRVTNPRYPMTMGVTVESAYACSCDGHWSASYDLQQTKMRGIIHKRVDVTNFAVYVNNERTELANLGPTEFLAFMCKTIASSKAAQLPVHEFVIEPLSTTVLMTVNESRKPDLRHPKVTANVHLEHVRVTLREVQVLGLLKTAEYLSNNLLWTRYRRFHPQESVFASPKRWWHFAYKCIVMDIQEERHRKSWTYILERNRDRRRYKTLWQNYLLHSDELKRDDRDEYQRWALERKYTYADIVFFRTVAEEELDRRLKAQRPRGQRRDEAGLDAWMRKKAGKASRWYSMSLEQRRELYRELEYTEDDERVKYRPPKEYVQSRLCVSLAAFRFTLMGGASERLVAVEMDDTTVNVFRRSPGFLLETTVSRFAVRDLYTPRTSYKTIIGATDADDRVSTTRSSLRNRAASPTGVAPGEEALLQLSVSRLPTDGRADWVVHVDMRPTQVVFSKPLYNRLLSFSQLYKGVNLNSVETHAKKVVRRWAHERQRGFVHAVKAHQTIEWHVDIRAPQIIIPESPNWESTTLALDLGQLRVQSDVLPVHFRNPEHGDFYDKYVVGLYGVRVVLTHQGIDWRDERPQYENARITLLERTDIVTKVQTSIFPQDPGLPMVKVHLDLGALEVHMSSLKLALLINLYNTISTKPRRYMTSLPAGAYVSTLASVDEPDFSNLFTVEEAEEKEEDFRLMVGRELLVLNVTSRRVVLAFREDRDTKTLADPNAKRVVTLHGRAVRATYTRRMFDAVGHVYLTDFAVEDHVQALGPEYAFLVRSNMPKRPPPRKPDFPGQAPPAGSEAPRDMVSIYYNHNAPHSPNFDGVRDLVRVQVQSMRVECNRASINTIIDSFLYLQRVWDVAATARVANSADPIAALSNRRVQWNARKQREAAAKAYNDRVRAALKHPKAYEWKLELQVRAVSVSLNKDVAGERLADVLLDDSWLEMGANPHEWMVQGALGHVGIEDVTEQGWRSPHRHVLQVYDPSQPLLSLSYTKYDKRSPLYPGYDRDLKATLTSVRVVASRRFFTDLQLYLLDAKDLYFVSMESLEKVRQVAEARLQREAKMRLVTKFDVHVHTPVIVVPRHTMSTDVVLVELGSLHALNVFVEDEFGDTVEQAAYKLRGASVQVAREGEAGSSSRVIDAFDAEVLVTVPVANPVSIVRGQVTNLTALASKQQFDTVFDVVRSNMLEARDAARRATLLSEQREAELLEMERQHERELSELDSGDAALTNEAAAARRRATVTWGATASGRTGAPTVNETRWTFMQRKIRRASAVTDVLQREASKRARRRPSRITVDPELAALGLAPPPPAAGEYGGGEYEEEHEETAMEELQRLQQEEEDLYNAYTHANEQRANPYERSETVLTRDWEFVVAEIELTMLSGNGMLAGRRSDLCVLHMQNVGAVMTKYQGEESTVAVSLGNVEVLDVRSEAVHRALLTFHPLESKITETRPHVNARVYTDARGERTVAVAFNRPRLMLSAPIVYEIAHWLLPSTLAQAQGVQRFRATLDSVVGEDEEEEVWAERKMREQKEREAQVKPLVFKFDAACTEVFLLEDAVSEDSQTLLLRGSVYACLAHTGPYRKEQQVSLEEISVATCMANQADLPQRTHVRTVLQPVRVVVGVATEEQWRNNAPSHARTFTIDVGDVDMHVSYQNAFLARSIVQSWQATHASYMRHHAVDRALSEAVADPTYAPRRPRMVQDYFQIALGSVGATVLNDCLQRSSPLIDVLLPFANVNAQHTQTGARHEWSVRVQGGVQADLFNTASMVWEPLVETWRGRVALDTAPHVKVLVQSNEHELVNVNVSLDTLLYMRRVLRMWAMDMRERRERAAAEAEGRVYSAVSRVRYAPYTIVNKTGHALEYFIPNAESAQLAVGEEHSVHVPPRMVTRRGTAHVADVARHLGVVLKRTVVDDVPLDRVGHYVFAVEKHAFGEEAVLQANITAVGEAKRVTLSSSITLHNNTAVSLEVCYANAARGINIIEVIEAGALAYVPIACTLGGRMLLRPVKGSAWSAPLELANMHVQPLHVLALETHTSYVLRVHGEALRTRTSHATAYTVHIEAPLAVVNLTAGALSVRVRDRDGEAVDEQTLDKGDKGCVFAASVQPGNTISIKMSGLEWSPSVPVDAAQRSVMCNSEENKSSLTMSLEVRDRHVYVFSRYWLVSKMPFPLAFREVGSWRTSPDKVAQGTLPADHTLLGVPRSFDYNYFDVRSSKVSLSINGSEPWCDAFSIDTVGATQRLHLEQREGLAVEAGVSVHFAPGDFSRTRVITIAPRYTLHNAFGVPLTVREWCEDVSAARLEVSVDAFGGQRRQAMWFGKSAELARHEAHMVLGLASDDEDSDGDDGDGDDDESSSTIDARTRKELKQAQRRNDRATVARLEGEMAARAERAERRRRLRAKRREERAKTEEMMKKLNTRRWVQFRLQQTGGEWSAPVDVSAVATQSVRLSNRVTEENMLLHVAVRYADPSVRIELSGEDTPPYRLENRTSYALRVSQHGVNEWEMLAPFSTCAYAWVQPTQAAELDVAFSGTISRRTVPLDRVHTYAPYEVRHRDLSVDGVVHMYVAAQGRTRVLVVAERADKYWQETVAVDEDAGQQQQQQQQQTGSAAAVPAAGGDATRWEVMGKMAGLGLSWLDRGIEVFFMSLRDTEVSVVCTHAETQMALAVQHMQLDNQLHHADVPVLLRTRAGEASLSTLKDAISRGNMTEAEADAAARKPSLAMSAVLSNVHRGVTLFKYIGVSVQEMDIALDEGVLVEALELNKRLHKLLVEEGRVWARLQPYQSHAAVKLMYMELLQLHAMRTSVSFALAQVEDEAAAAHRGRRGRQGAHRGDAAEVALSRGAAVHGADNPVRRAAKLLGVPLMEVRNVPLSFNSLTFRDVFSAHAELVGPLSAHYKRALFFQAYKFVGSLNILGNPVGLVSSLGTGMVSFFEEPLKANVLAPAEFGTGLAKGTLALVKHSLQGALGSASGMTSATGSLLTALTFDEETVLDRRRNQRAPPRHVGEGLLQGAETLGRGIMRGVTGLVTQPMRGARRSGVGGFVRGMGRGVAGLAMQPAAAAMSFAQQTVDGASAMLGVGGGPKGRVRLPRLVPTHDGTIRAYCHAEAVLQEVMWREKWDHERIFHVFTLARGEQVLLLSDVRVAVVLVKPRRVRWTMRWEHFAATKQEHHMVHVHPVPRTGPVCSVGCDNDGKAEAVLHAIESVREEWIVLRAMQ